MAASLKRRAKDHGDECFYLLRKARKSGDGLAWTAGRGAGSQAKGGCNDSVSSSVFRKDFQLIEDTVSPGAHLPGSRPASSSKNVPFPLLETRGSPSLSRQRGDQRCNVIRHIENKKYKETKNCKIPPSEKTWREPEPHRSREWD